MFDIKARTIKNDGKIFDAKIDIKISEGVSAVFVDSIEGDLACDCAVQFELSPKFKIKEYMADSERTTFWRQPFFGAKMNEIPLKSQFIVFKLDDGNFCVVLPVVTKKYKCVISGGKENLIYAKIYSGYAEKEKYSGLALLYASGKNPIELTKKCVKQALKILKSNIKIVEEREYPEIFEYLGWCTWDSMQIRVCEEGIIRKCEELKEKKIPVKWIILDDMWAEVHNFYEKKYTNFKEMVDLMYSSSLDSFEADKIRFPNGLSSIISKVKQFGIKVGVWYPIIGYWNGITKNSDAYKMLGDFLIKTSEGRYVPDWKEKQAYKYYKTINTMLKDKGADFVKVDRQSDCELDYKGLAPIGQIAEEYHNALERSAEEVFGGIMINCMGMASEDLWSRKSSPITRCSDDFQPENREWFTKHILQCAYNSVLQGQLYYCDWDMWWTDDSQALKNSIMRAISGGPIYVSDKIGRTKKEILEPLILENGKILRCDRCALPTWDCITSDCTKNGQAIKIQNIANEHGIMAVINIDKDNGPVTAKISGRMIDGFDAEEYAVYEHFSKELKILSQNEFIDVTLKDNDEFKLYIFAPIKNGFATIGRIDKFISPATIDHIHGESIVLKEDGPYAYVKDGNLVIKRHGGVL